MEEESNNNPSCPISTKANHNKMNVEPPVDEKKKGGFMFNLNQNISSVTNRIIGKSVKKTEK